MAHTFRYFHEKHGCIELNEIPLSPFTKGGTGIRTQGSSSLHWGQDTKQDIWMLTLELNKPPPGLPLEKGEEVEQCILFLRVHGVDYSFVLVVNYFSPEFSRWGEFAPFLCHFFREQCESLHLLNPSKVCGCFFDSLTVKLYNRGASHQVFIRFVHDTILVGILCQHLKRGNQQGGNVLSSVTNGHGLVDEDIFFQHGFYQEW